MADSNFFKNAVLQAKEIKNHSVELAKDQFLESLTPRIQSLVQGQLSEEADDEFEDSVNEAFQEELDEDFDLTGFIQEDEEPKDDTETDPAPAEPATDTDDSFGSEDTDSTDDFGADSTETGDLGADGGLDAEISGETSIADLTVDEFKSLWQELIAGGSGEPEASIDPALGDSGEGDLGSIDSIDTDTEPGDDEDEEFNLSEVISEVEKKMSSVRTINGLKKQLAEAKSALKQVQQVLVETNLLNSKLIYVNKLFNKTSLSESDKATVLKSIDSATTPKEAKLVYEALYKTYTKPKAKGQIKEAKSFASAPAGVAPTKNPVIEDTLQSRFKFLAGITDR